MGVREKEDVVTSAEVVALHQPPPCMRCTARAHACSTSPTHSGALLQGEPEGTRPQQEVGLGGLRAESVTDRDS